MEHELEGQGDEQAQPHEDEVLEPIHEDGHPTEPDPGWGVRFDRLERWRPFADLLDPPNASAERKEPWLSSTPSPQPSGAPASLASIAAAVDERLRTFLHEETKRWTDLDGTLGPPLDALAGLVLGGGKRLRPAFCHWGFVLGGGAPDDPSVVDAGAAFELLHAFALIHDDVVDDSSTRRGRSAMHVLFTDEHQAGGYGGEGRRFGEGAAILIGDLAHVYADALLLDTPPAAWELWNELRVELNMGQFLDVVGTARGDTDPATAWRIARYKSAKYTIERPLHLGVTLAGGRIAFDQWGARLSAYGVPLGEAFQLRDDLLGVFGDEATTGKPVGDDLREGKPTPLLASVRERVDSSAQPLLARIGADDLTPDEVGELQQVFIGCGAVDEIEETVARLRTEALAVLDRAPPFPADVVAALTDLAWYVTVRDV
jgi:geranylgeranyl diphosphate synthase type I